MPFGVFPQENFEAILEMIELIQIPDNNDFSKKQDISVYQKNGLEYNNFHGKMIFLKHES